MNNKYMPIGTVCDINDSNKKFMIIGYNKNSNDYEALPFPMGSTDNSQPIFFNHSAINEVYSLGYKNDESINYVKGLSNGANNVDLSKLVFDENGVVLVDNTAPEVEVSTEEPYHFDEVGIVIADETAAEVEEVVETVTGEVVPEEEAVEEVAPAVNYQFDENGTVVTDVTAEVVASSEEPYHFDETGIVIADETAAEVEEAVEMETPAPAKAPYHFDENGVVVEDETSALVEPLTAIRFDENGIVIADDTAPVAEEVVETETPASRSNIEFDENGVVVADHTAAPTPGYQFDENGVVVSE